MSEVERRYADQSPSWLIPRLAAMQNLRELWAEQKQKRAHDHILQYRAMGQEDIVKDGLGETEMPGDINIQGDNYYYGAPPQNGAVTKPPSPAPAPAQPKPQAPRYTKTDIENYIKRKVVQAVGQQPQQQSGWSRYWPLAAGLVLGGLGIGGAAVSILRPPGTPAPYVDTDTDTDTIVELDFPASATK